MKLMIPQPLLDKLRARRHEQAEARAGLVRRDTLSLWQGNFATAIRDLVSQRLRGPTLARSYVAQMDTLQDEVEVAHDAFLIDPGMGPMIYLSADGRVLEDGRSWDGAELRELTSEDEIIAALVVGANKTGIEELLTLIPAAPPEATQCPRCQGARRAALIPGQETLFICTMCHGRGWATGEMVATAPEVLPHSDVKPC